ncbi:hypothetical protein ACYX7E_02935 [Luteimonas sp. RIT-PG2_3]
MPFTSKLSMAALATGSLLVLALSQAAAQAPAQAPPAAGAVPASVPFELTAADIQGSPYKGPRVATPRGQDGKPDLTGYWRGIRTPGKPGGNLGKDEPDFILPFSEQGKRALLYSQNHTRDPESICILGGIPRHNGSGLPFEILHTPERLATIYHYNTHRWVDIGADLKHAAQLEPLYFGHGIGKWDGDTLVIETRGLKDSVKDFIWLDENGNPTSDQTTVVERWTRPDHHHLQLEMTVTDLKYYTRPFVFKRTWVLGDPGLGLGEYPCNENNLEADHLGPGAGVIGPDGTRGFGYDAPLPEVPPGPEAYGF